jgi:hypothetical protein
MLIDEGCPTCTLDGQTCQANEDCCGGYCNPDTNICGDRPNMCATQLQGCTTSSDCCAGLVCGGGLCLIQ